MVGQRAVRDGDGLGAAGGAGGEDHVGEVTGGGGLHPIVFRAGGQLRRRRVDGLHAVLGAGPDQQPGAGGRQQVRAPPGREGRVERQVAGS